MFVLLRRLLVGWLLVRLVRKVTARRERPPHRQR
jgi:hypothetical protein